MIKFINSMNNLIFNIFNVEKVIVIFFTNNDINSLQLVDKISVNDIDLVANIILVEYNSFLKENYNKLNKNFIKNQIKSFYKNNLENQIDNLFFLTFDNIIDIKLPQLYFLKKNKEVMELKYNSQYLTNYVDNNIIYLITSFFEKSKSKMEKKNNYAVEFNVDGEVCYNLNETEIIENIVFI